MYYTNPRTNVCGSFRLLLSRMCRCLVSKHIVGCVQWRNDGVAAASTDGGPTGGRGPPTVLEFLVINISVCLVLLSNCCTLCLKKTRHQTLAHNFPKC